MKSQLVVFNGGLQTKVSPHLAEANKAIACINVNLDKGSIYPFGAWLADDVNTATGIYGVYHDETLITNSADTDVRSYAVFGNRLYWTNGSYSAYGLLRWNGSTGVNAVAPTVNTYGASTATPTGTGLLNNTYDYVYTVVDTDGIESAPSPTFQASPVNQNVAISLDPTTVESVTETVAKRRIYRTGGSNPTLNLVAELTAPTLTYTDSTRDLDVSRIELSTFDNYAPPANLDHLVENYGVMWGSVGDRVYFSKEGQPEFWNPLDFVVLNEDCTGIGSFKDVIVAFTEKDAYLITGSNRDNIALEKLPYNEGCSVHHSITNVSELLVWTSKNGVCIFDGNGIQVVTRDILTWTSEAFVGTATFDMFSGSFDSNVGYEVSYALGIQGKYYAVYQSGILVVDIDKGMLCYIITLDGVQSLVYNPPENELQGIDINFDIWKFNKDSVGSNAEWKTPELMGDSHSELKQFRRVKFDNAPNYVYVYVDGTKKLYVENKAEFYLPAGCIGHTVQFHIGTTEEIKSVRYEYGTISG